VNNFWLDLTENKKKINFVLENFDFGKVRAAMDALNWEWFGMGVPSINQLKEMAKRLLENLNLDATEISCGGFRADLYEGDFRLSFCVEDAESTYYKEEQI